MGGHSIFNLFSWEHRLSQKNSQDQGIRTMIDGSDPINAVNVCSTKSTNKLRHFRIFLLFILFEEHSHHLNQAITKSNCGKSEPS